MSEDKHKEFLDKYWRTVAPELLPTLWGLTPIRKAADREPCGAVCLNGEHKFVRKWEHPFSSVWYACRYCGVLPPDDFFDEDLYDG